MIATRRTLPTIITLLVAAGLVLFGVSIQSAGQATATPATVTEQAHTLSVPAPVTPVCHEVMPCWNSCTMGNLNPCDLSATLPGGAWFRVEVELPTVPLGCGQGWVPARVTVVAVAAPEGERVLASTRSLVCVELPEDMRDLPYELGNTLPRLYRAVAAELSPAS